MLTGPEVLEAMSAGFTPGVDHPLAEPLMQILEATQAAGGDKRGQRSVELRVHGRELNPRVDLRVDEHSDPMSELRRVLGISTAQLATFVAGMPKHGAAVSPPLNMVVELLLLSPPDLPRAAGPECANGD